MASLERLSSPQIRPLGLNLTTLPGARLYFYENNSTTPAVTYQDKAGEIPHANPVVADANGIFPQIFLEQKLYRMTLTDKKNIVQPGFPLNDIGQDTIVVPFGPWIETRSYSEGEIVTGSNGNWYSSVGDNNLGHDPVDGSGDWENIPIPIASNFTSNVGWATFSSVDDKISVNFNIAEMTDAVEEEFFETNPKVSTSFRTAAISKVTNVKSIDPDLSISALSAGWYEIDVYIHFTTEGSNTNGIQAEIVATDGSAFGFPATAGAWEHIEGGITSSKSYNNYLTAAVLTYPSNPAANNSLTFKGMVNNSAGAGICITWAQGTLTPGNATRIQCGYIKATKLLDM